MEESVFVGAFIVLRKSVEVIFPVDGCQQLHTLRSDFGFII